MKGSIEPRRAPQRLVPSLLPGPFERRRAILKIIVQEHVATARPVASETIARHYALGVSPATIRNEMAALEEMGYIHQLHTSAGRVPSHGTRATASRLAGLRHSRVPGARRVGGA